MNNKYLICILGPTASGKTSLAIEIAKRFNTEIISTDSRQFYKEMNIGTAKPNKEELAAVKHHFIDCLSIEKKYTAGDFEHDALETITELHKKNDVVVLAGGSGLYINAILFGIDPFPEISKEIREKILNLYKTEGLESIKDVLRKLDPEFYCEVDLDNPRRIMRAIEVCWASETTYSSFRKKEAKQRDFKVIKIAYDYEREELYKRIEKRVDIMLKEGLEAEVKGLEPYKELLSLQTIGYKEFFNYFDGIIDKERAIELVKQNSRRYAKRQLTWFRKDEEINWIKPGIDLQRLFEMIKLEMS
ncbi:MAG: tRNA dimethylallyltransferase [Planctomycetota bacterium]|jgi:tRNA dimethylallyltransferase